MNRDNLLFATIGILVGFIAGFLIHEVMSSHQPPRLTPELRAQIVTPGGEQGGAPAAAPEGAQEAQAPDEGAAPAAGGGQPPMQAIQELKAYVEKNPNDAKAVRQLAELNLEIRNWKRAQELYLHYLELKPNDPDVLTELAYSYRGTQQFDQALQHLKEAQKAAPDHWQAYFYEVVVLAFDLKKFDDANQVLAKLQQLQPGNPDVARLAAEVAKQRNAA
ncbi:MAG TPA: tetratricopeptide repeat protein [Thermoanaerobaculia bacterium]|nr:tetratricopeptide repeat protein [Thermoanaerobaculia bacterium]